MKPLRGSSIVWLGLDILCFLAALWLSTSREEWEWMGLYLATTVSSHQAGYTKRADEEAELNGQTLGPTLPHQYIHKNWND